MHDYRLKLQLGIWVALLAVGCASDDAVDTGADGGADSTTDASATSPMTTITTDTTTASTTVTTEMTSVSTEEGTESDSDPSSSDATDPSDTDTGGGVCESCNAGEYCDWAADTCGAQRFDEPTCTPLPDGCPALVEDPICGCDGVVYSGTCSAALLGVDVDADGECAAPAGTFQCGYLFCDAETTYCQWSVSDVGGTADGYSCVPLPQGCGDTPSCECLAEEPCAEFACDPTEDGGLRVTCPGG